MRISSCIKMNVLYFRPRQIFPNFCTADKHINQFWWLYGTKKEPWTVPGQRWWNSEGLRWIQGLFFHLFYHVYVAVSIQIVVPEHFRVPLFFTHPGCKGLTAGKYIPWPWSAGSGKVRAPVSIQWTRFTSWNPKYKWTWLSESGHYLCLREAGIIWTVSEQWNMVNVTDISGQIEPSPHTLPISIFCQAAVVDLHVSRACNTRRPGMSSSRASSSALLTLSVLLCSGSCQLGLGCHVNFHSSSNSAWIQALSHWLTHSLVTSRSLDLYRLSVSLCFSAFFFFFSCISLDPLPYFASLWTSYIFPVGFHLCCRLLHKIENYTFSFSLPCNSSNFSWNQQILPWFIVHYVNC